MKQTKTSTSSPCRVALVHDYLRDYGGAERVLEALHELFPEAPIFVSFVDEKVMGSHWKRFENWDIRQSWMVKIPGYKKIFSPLRVMSPQFFRSFDLSGYDVILSSTNAYFSKAITVPQNATHLCYCHTPARSLYGYPAMSNWKKNPIIRFGGELINHYLRMVDYEVASKNVSLFIANSKETAHRIEKFYRLSSQIIYPPCQVAAVPPASDVSRGYYLYVNRLALAKHPELAVQAANQLKIPLKVVGTGPLLDSLKKIAGSTVEILGAVDDAKLQQLYAGAKALLYPVEFEDFGMVPIEAMGHGVPVIAHRSGGPTETVLDGKTGLFFDDLTQASLVAAVQKSQKIDWDAKIIWQHAQHYSTQVFKEKITALVASYCPRAED